MQINSRLRMVNACVHRYTRTDKHTHTHTQYDTIQYNTIHTFIHAYIRTYYHTYVHIYRHTCIYTRIHIRIYVQTYMHMYMRTHTIQYNTYIHTYILSYIYSYTYISAYIRTYTYIRTDIHAYVHAYAHITHTHTHTLGHSSIGYFLLIIPLVVFRLLFTSFYDICITQRGCLTSKLLFTFWAMQFLAGRLTASHLGSDIDFKLTEKQRKAIFLPCHLKQSNIIIPSTISVTFHLARK